MIHHPIPSLLTQINQKDIQIRELQTKLKPLQYWITQNESLKQELIFNQKQLSYYENHCQNLEKHCQQIERNFDEQISQYQQKMQDLISQLEYYNKNFNQAKDNLFNNTNNIYKQIQNQNEIQQINARQSFYVSQNNTYDYLQQQNDELKKYLKDNKISLLNNRDSSEDILRQFRNMEKRLASDQSSQKMTQLSKNSMNLCKEIKSNLHKDTKKRRSSVSSIRKSDQNYFRVDLKDLIKDSQKKQ